VSQELVAVIDSAADATQALRCELARLAPRTNYNNSFYGVAEEQGPETAAWDLAGSSTPRTLITRQLLRNGTLKANMLEFLHNSSNVGQESLPFRP
jgi:hypothetical protein